MIHDSTDAAPLRIMPMGDSITAGYTDNPAWMHPFSFGYRSGLYQRLRNWGLDFQFVGESGEPWNQKFGDPTHGGTVRPALDLRKYHQDGHRGYGGWTVPQIQEQVSGWITEDNPHVILLMTGINGIGPESPGQLDLLLKTILETDPLLRLIVAQITPLKNFNQDLFSFNTCLRETLVPAYANQGFHISTVDLYTLFLRDPSDPESIDPSCFSNEINHPTNAVYDEMAESWFQAIKRIIP